MISGSALVFSLVSDTVSVLLGPRGVSLGRYPGVFPRGTLPGCVPTVGGPEAPRNQRK